MNALRTASSRSHRCTDARVDAASVRGTKDGVEVGAGSDGEGEAEPLAKLLCVGMCIGWFGDVDGDVSVAAG